MAAPTVANTPSASYLEQEGIVGAFVTDTFSDISSTALESHTGELGATWALHSSYTAVCVISNTSRCRRSGTGGAGSSVYYASGTPANADYDVIADVVVRNDNNTTFGVAGRIDVAANTMYNFRHDTNQATHAWRLFKIVAGTATQLGSDVNQTLNIDQAYNCKLEMRGTTIKGYVDSVEVISATDSAIATAGLAGFRFTNASGGDSVGIHLDNFSAIGGPTTTADFDGSTHTSSGGSNRCLGAVITVSSNSNTIRTLTSLTWNGTTMTKAAEQGHDDAGGNATTITICTLNDPPVSTAGAILATYNDVIEHAQIRFYNVEGCPAGAADAFATDVDDGAGGTAVDISIAPTVIDTLCIMGVVQLSSAGTHTFSPLTENDDRVTASSALNSAIASGVLAASGAQSVQATLSVANEFSAVAITLSGAASGGTVGRGLTDSVLLERRSLVG